MSSGSGNGLYEPPEADSNAVNLDLWLVACKLLKIFENGRLTLINQQILTGINKFYLGIKHIHLYFFF